MLTEDRLVLMPLCGGTRTRRGISKAGEYIGIGAGHALRSGLSRLSYRCDVESISLICVKRYSYTESADSVQDTDTAKSKVSK